MKKYIPTPVTIENGLRGNTGNDAAVLDNLIDLTVFTPRGSFLADPDFGFEYWDHEYANVHYLDFNNGQTGLRRKGEASREKCEESIINSLKSYAPFLKDLTVSVELQMVNSGHGRREYSKYQVVVVVNGSLEGGLGTMEPYSRTIRFLMEPTAKII